MAVSTLRELYKLAENKFSQLNNKKLYIVV